MDYSYSEDEFEKDSSDETRSEKSLSPLGEPDEYLSEKITPFRPDITPGRSCLQRVPRQPRAPTRGRRLVFGRTQVKFYYASREEREFKMIVEDKDKLDAEANDLPYSHIKMDELDDLDMFASRKLKYKKVENIPKSKGGINGNRCDERLTNKDSVLGNPSECHRIGQEASTESADIRLPNEEGLNMLAKSGLTSSSQEASRDVDNISKVKERIDRLSDRSTGENAGDAHPREQSRRLNGKANELPMDRGFAESFTGSVPKSAVHMSTKWTAPTYSNGITNGLNRRHGEINTGRKPLTGAREWKMDNTCGKKGTMEIKKSTGNLGMKTACGYKAPRSRSADLSRHFYSNDHPKEEIKLITDSTKAKVTQIYQPKHNDDLAIAQPSGTLHKSADMEGFNEDIDDRGITKPYDTESLGSAPASQKLKSPSRLGSAGMYGQHATPNIFSGCREPSSRTNPKRVSGGVSKNLPTTQHCLLVSDKQVLDTGKCCGNHSGAEKSTVPDEVSLGSSRLVRGQSTCRDVSVSMRSSTLIGSNATSVPVEPLVPETYSVGALSTEVESSDGTPGAETVKKITVSSIDASSSSTNTQSQEEPVMTTHSCSHETYESPEIMNSLPASKHSVSDQNKDSFTPAKSHWLDRFLLSVRRRFIRLGSRLKSLSCLS